MKTERGNDPLLTPLLRAGPGEEHERALAELLSEHAYQRIDRIVAAKFRQFGFAADHRDDVRNDIVIRIINRLHRLVHSHDAQPIEKFADYVAVVAFNTIDNFGRQADPARVRLRNRVRYALRHDRRFALWEAPAGLLAGLSGWRGNREGVEEVRPISFGTSRKLSDLLIETFERTSRPVYFESLVAALSPLTASERPPFPEPAVARSPAEKVENAAYLHRLWREICDLPPRQRAALLLNVRDATGESVTRLLPVTGIATVGQIGESLSIDAGVFAGLWADLPLEDAKIAVILGVSRQQVINLRRAARERLSRRLQDFRERKGKK